MKKTSKTKRKATLMEKPARRGKDAVIERYGGITFADDKMRRELIDWLEENFAIAVAVFGSDLVQRKLCELKAINFEFDYDDPND